MERVVDCPICNDVDRCFEEVQKEYSSFMCFNCGFMSDTRFTEDNQDKIDQDTTILINKLKTFDYQRDIWWFPAVVNMGKLGIIYPDGTEDKWEWKYQRIRKMLYQIIKICWIQKMLKLIINLIFLVRVRIWE